LPSRSQLETAKLNLHASRAALITARSRLHDAELRHAEAWECPISFIASGTGSSDLLWWQAQVEQAERAVADAEAQLQLAMASA
jgi:hypothetical protein